MNRRQTRGRSGWLREQYNRRPKPLWMVIVADLLIFGIALVVFALFHHVLPRREQSVGLVSSRDSAGSDVIDSAMYEENGRYYLFVKSDHNPSRVILLTAPHATGPFARAPAFDESMAGIAEGMYEAPTAVRTDDGKWCLFLDFYGVQGAGQGYVPFVADSLESGRFVRSDARFSFPFGFKHGTILPITPQEYDRMKAHDWSQVPDGR